MTVTLTYNHEIGQVSIKFAKTEPNEEGIGFGFGRTPNEAAEKMIGPFSDGSDILDKFYATDPDTPYLVFQKKMSDGSIVRSKKVINIQEDWPNAPTNSLTVRTYTF